MTHSTEPLFVIGEREKRIIIRRRKKKGSHLGNEVIIFSLGQKSRK